ncbi:MAG: hypothetical protein M2R46_01909 [Verrucomicrobia subdivision 3 bacterium]|nr:hypothetical protein [Limisphaerales bacterium]
MRFFQGVLGLDGEGRTGGSAGACRCRGSAVNFHHWPLAIGGEEATFGIGKRGFRGKASGRSRRPKFVKPRGAPCRASRAPGPLWAVEDGWHSRDVLPESGSCPALRDGGSRESPPHLTALNQDY